MKILFSDIGNSPSLLLYDATPQEIDELVDALNSAASGSTSLVEIHKLRGISPNNDIHLSLKTGDSNFGVRKIGDKAFECVHTADEWAWISDLVSELKRPWEGTHQYLSSSGDIQLIISTGLGW